MPILGVGASRAMDDSDVRRPRVLLAWLGSVGRVVIMPSMAAAGA
jgi:hypothetical protein